MNNETIEHLIATQPDLRDARAKLEAMQDGAYCMHGSWGFGQIKKYDPETGKLVIDFPGADKMNHAMAPAFCVSKLEILSPDNILVRQQTEPDIVASLVKNDPAKLVKDVLRAAPRQSMSGIELERTIVRLIGEAKAKRWWASAKKALVKDPELAVPAKREGQYAFHEEPTNPVQEILDKYHLNKDPRKKIELAEELFKFSQGRSFRNVPANERDIVNLESFEEDLRRIFEELTVAVKSARRLTKAQCLHGIWVRNDLCRHFKENVEQLEPTSGGIIATCDEHELSELAAQIPQTPSYLKRLLDLITRVYEDPAQWETIIIGLLRNSTGKFTAECINFFIEHDRIELVARQIREWQDAQALMSPVLSWIIKNRTAKRYSPILQPLVGHQLLAAILRAIDNEALLASTTRRIPLADDLDSDKELVQDLLADASFEVARDLAQSLLLNQGFQPLTKKSILARFIRIHPKIQNLVAGDGATQGDQQLIVSQWSLDARKRELEDILKNKIPENKKAIAIAKEHGDLKENSEYKMARQDQETLLARKSQLESDLTLGRITDFAEVTTETVGIGSIVELSSSASAKAVRYTILGAWDSAPDENIVSYKTPLAQKLLGKKVGETVQTEIDENIVAWTIRNIERWVDSQK